MPIRINLLAEQQAAEEARRRDPVKRAIVVGGSLVVFTLLWTLMTYMQVKAKRAEFANEDSKFKRLEDDSKAVRMVQAEVGDLERRLVCLDRYSTNRVLWATMLDAMQRATFDQIRLKSISANQRYITNPPTVFFSTNINVPFSTKPPAWKFWAGNPAMISPTDVAAKSFRSFTNQFPFSTNKLPYLVKSSTVSTNAIANQVEVKCDFQLVANDVEDIELFLAGGDYGNPPGTTIDEFARTVVNLPYFKERLAEGDEKLRFVERPPNAEPDPLLPNSPMFKRFTVRLKYKERVLTNE
jgi:hypothetical protein